MRRRFEAGRVVDLELVAAAQVDAAVRLLGHAELEVQLEVVEFLDGHEVGAAVRILQGAVDRAPLIFTSSYRLPPVERLAVEERDR
jgi:hypothetical protein